MSLKQLSRFDGGLVQQRPSYALEDYFTPDARNVEILPSGKLRLPRLGCERFTASAVGDDAIDGLWQLRRADGTWVYVLASGGQLYTMDATAAVTALGAPLTFTRRRWQAVTYGGRLLIFNGADMPRSYKTELERLVDVEGATLPLNWKAGNWPRGVSLLNAGENEHLAAFGLGRDRSAVYFSAVKNPLKWNWLEAGSTAGRVVVREEDGEEVVAVADFAGLTLVMKETTTVAYLNLNPHTSECDGMTVYPWGCASAESVVRHENGLAWWARWQGGHGPLTLRAVQDYANIAGEAMAWRIEAALAEVSPSHLHLISGYWNDALDCVRWLVPSRKSARATMLFDYYPYRQAKDDSGRRLGAFHVGEFAGDMDVSCVLPLVSEGGPLVLAGDTQGYVNRLGFGQTDLGAEIESYYAFPTLVGATSLRVTGLEAVSQAGGSALRGSLAWNDGGAQTVGGLAPNLPDGKTCRLWPFGQGYRVQARVDHDGSAHEAEFEGLLLQLDPTGMR